jgi:hypothetical protein
MYTRVHSGARFLGNHLYILAPSEASKAGVMTHETYKASGSLNTSTLAQVVYCRSNILQMLYECKHQLKAVQVQHRMP